MSIKQARQMLTEPTFEQPCAYTISAVTNAGIESGRSNQRRDRVWPQ